MSRRAVVIGAGPAGLTLAHELVSRTDIHPVVLEMSDHMGGISRTVEHNGNRIDLGGHRFFSKSDRVMEWWLDRLPLQRTSEGDPVITHQRQRRAVDGAAEGPDPDQTDRVMLVRSRKSRILYGGKLFEYPISLSLDTLMKLGLLRTVRIGSSYLRARASPIRPERNLEQFFINRFGRELYATFFRDYTEKIWGTPCSEISAEWGAQRIKGLSITKAVAHVLRRAFGSGNSIAQKETETSLIERFLYPKYGPGQMWDVVAEEIVAAGGEIRRNVEVTGVDVEDGRVTGVRARAGGEGEELSIAANLVFSTMPIRTLLRGLSVTVPDEIREISEGLQYRDFITVGLLLDGLLGTAPGTADWIEDNWIYVQEPGVEVGRMQIFNNWSPYMVADPSKVWIGLEFFCNDTDPMWTQDDAQMTQQAVEELSRMGLATPEDVRDSVVLRMPKTYPAYFGTYDRFDELRAWVDGIHGLYLLGRNGMHRYNNQDHSMLTAMTAVDNLVEGREDRDNIWNVNTEQDYHEVKEQE